MYLDMEDKLTRTMTVGQVIVIAAEANLRPVMYGHPREFGPLCVKVYSGDRELSLAINTGGYLETFCYSQGDKVVPLDLGRLYGGDSEYPEEYPGVYDMGKACGAHDDMTYSEMLPLIYGAFARRSGPFSANQD